VTKDKTGLFGLGKEKMADVVLIPGLKVDVDGTSGEMAKLWRKPSPSMAMTWKPPR
jgi:hypothetical protein